MFGAGVLSGLFGIGSGAVKVLAMDQAMKIPFKVSTTTSNFMIGVTAAASAGIYSSRGYIMPGVAMPVMLGVLADRCWGRESWFEPKSSPALDLRRSSSLLFGYRDDLQRGDRATVKTRRINDERIEIMIGVLLRVGVLLSAAVVAIGAIIYLARHGQEIPRFDAFHGEIAATEELVWDRARCVGRERNGPSFNSDCYC